MMLFVSLAFEIVFRPHQKNLDLAVLFTNHKHIGKRSENMLLFKLQLTEFSKKKREILQHKVK